MHGVREMQECWPQWAPYATLLPIGRAADAATLTAIDSDSDGVISRDELRKWLDTAPWRSEEVARVVGDDTYNTACDGGDCDSVVAAHALRSVLARNMHHFHDLDSDGTVRLDEAVAVMQRWSAADRDAEPIRDLFVAFEE